MHPRRLKKRGRASPRHQSPAISRFDEIEKSIWEQQAPTGFCEDEYCSKCIETRQRIEDMVECARHAYQAAIRHKGIPEDIREQIFHEAYQDAMHQMEQKHQHQLALAHQQAYVQAQTALQHDLMRAKNAAFQRGFQAGRLSAPQPTITPVNMAAVRQQMIDEMLNECKVIGESNPNMKPGVNAVRHRIKKLRK